MSIKWPRILIFLVFFTLLTVLGFSYAYYSAGEIYQFADSIGDNELPDVDAIVCLAGGRGRVRAAGDLWYRYWQGRKVSPGVEKKKAPVLYLSGMGPQATWGLISKQIRPAVLEAISPGDVIIENESSNTDRNAQWLTRYARDLHWNKVLLFTSSYHMKRAYFIFDQVLKSNQVPLKIETVSFYQEPFGAKEWRNELNGVRVTLLEYLKWVYYRSFWHSKPQASSTLRAQIS